MVTETLLAPHLPSNEHEEPLPIFERSLLKDFFLSFRFAQNMYYPHYQLLTYLAKGLSKDELVSVQQLSDSLSPAIGKMRIPAHHSRSRISNHTLINDFNIKMHIDEEDEHSEFLRVWNAYLQIIGHVVFGAPPNLSDIDIKNVVGYSAFPEKSLVCQIAKHLIERDTHYQTQPRYMKTAEGDSHESFIKTYALDGQPTGSTRFDYLFKGIRGLILLDDIFKDDLFKFDRKWQMNHPNQPNMFAWHNTNG